MKSQNYHPTTNTTRWKLMQLRSHDRLRRDSSHVPVTGLALYRAPSPSGKLFALAGVDTDVVVYDAGSETSRVVCRIPVFADQPVHGIHVQKVEGDAAAAVLVWGSRDVALFSTRDFIGTDDGTQRKAPVVATATAPDWICDGAISPFDSSVGMLATAHNEVVPLRYSSSTGEISLGAAIHLSRPMLFTARILWESEKSVLVAGGTVFGHVIVWRYRWGHDGRATEFLFNLQGFEGSIFGVDISPLVTLSDGSTVRLLAGCSDDRTIRIWDITERRDGSSGSAAAASQLDQDIDTGFGGNSGNTEDTEASVGTENTPAPIAVAMGHASRIWGVRFAPVCGVDTLPVYSFGEDATSQRWLLKVTSKTTQGSPASKLLTGKLSHDRALSLHHGKHLWSNAILAEEDKTIIATGGGDSQVNLIEERVNTDVSNQHTGSGSSTILDVHDILKSVISPRTPAAGKEIISRYDFLTPDQILVTTSQGRLLLGSLKSSNGHEWQEIDIDEATSAELKLCYVLKAVGDGSALLGTTSGKIYHFQVSGRQVSHLVTLSGKIVDINCLYKRNKQKGPVGVLVYLHGQADSHYLTLDPSAGSLHSHEQVRGLDPRFVATSAAMINGRLIIGSRHGWLSILEQDENGTYRPILDLATRSFDTITAILPLPRESSNPQEVSPYILVTSKDGKYRIYEIEKHTEVISLHLRHETSPPFGPVIAGAWFTQTAVPELILYGFRSKSFVIWNETRKEELANIDCGGAHRTFQLAYDELDPGRFRFAFTKTSKLFLHSSNKLSHKSLRLGVHGREIKALSSNGRYVASGAEDTSIRIWEHKSEEKGRQADLRCVATMKTHVTGIQRLTWFEENYLFSSAGNEEFFVWRVRELESSYKGLAVFCEGVFTDKSADGDLRIMDFDIVRPDHGDGIIITMGFSNSTLKTYRYTSDNGGFELFAEGSYTGACFTQTRHLSMRNGVLKILIASTDGHISLWGTGSGEGQAGNYVLEQAAQLHQNSVKSLDMVKTDEGYLVFTGGDDNGVGVALVEETSGNTDTHSWKVSSRGVVRKAHAAAVTGVALLCRGTEVFGVSVSNDQRVKAWRIASGRERRVGLLGEVCSGVADVGDISLIDHPAETRATIVKSPAISSRAHFFFISVPPVSYFNLAHLSIDAGKLPSPRRAPLTRDEVRLKIQGSTKKPITNSTMKSFLFLLSTLSLSPIILVAAAPVGPLGPCPDIKVDAILRGEMDPSECCSYGICKGDVVISVGN
ncbi:Endosomal recycling 2-like protein [Cladobotryum mycophilum]|uniref:Endosomal recycling 2-like protein n=1 Tax=Cladobotryum mycophilum TaxID=491253 RepID=A0ABR0SL22_9HYPO